MEQTAIVTIPEISVKQIVQAIKVQAQKERDTTAQNEYNNLLVAFKATDTVYRMLVACKGLYDEEKLDSLIERHISNCVKRKSTYIGYDMENMIKSKVVEYLLDNPNATFAQLYNFSTKHLFND